MSGVDLKRETRKRPQKTSDKIIVVVVESHQHVLEHIHAVLRKQKRLGQEWTMHHVDAHPDLACSKVFAGCCFRPNLEWQGKNLYEHLDLTASGISEWITPLILAASLKRVDWIVPEGVKRPQIPVGEYTFHVGVANTDQSDSGEDFLDLPDDARLHTDLMIPYYLDDGSYRATLDLSLRKQVELTVTNDTRNMISSDQPWLLDICLDYFVYKNPFIASVEELAGPSYSDLWERLSDRLKNLFDPSIEPEVYLSLRDAEIKRLSDIVDKVAMKGMSPELENGLDDEFYSSIKKMLEHCDVLKRQALIDSIKDCLPSLSMPHSNGDILDPGTLSASVQKVCNEALSGKPEPFMITIARSKNDGFTPAPLVDRLQQEILTAIHSTICECRKCPTNPNENSVDCALRLLFDYDEWEGSSI